MTNADEPILTDLKKLLRRLEKIDPEARKKARSPEFEPTANALNLQKAVLEEAKAGQPAKDGLLQLQSRRTGLPTDPGQSAELPVIVKPSLPVASAPEKETGALRVVVIASVTAAIVSALATGLTVYWLNGGAGNLGLLAPTQVAVRQPQAPAEPQITAAETSPDFALPAARTPDAAATATPIPAPVDELEVIVEPQVKFAEEPVDDALPAAQQVETAATDTPAEVGEPQVQAEPQRMSAEEPANGALPAAQTADAAPIGALATAEEQQVPVVPTLAPAEKPVDPSFSAAEAADSRAAGTLMSTNETRTSVVEGAVPAAEPKSDTAGSELDTPEPRIVTGPPGREQVPSYSGQPLSEPASRLADAAASAATIGSVTILSAATELAATLSSTGAIASESKALANLDTAETAHGSSAARAVNPTEDFGLFSEEVAGNSATTDNNASVVAAYEVPEDALLPRGGASQEPGAANPLEVALLHPKEASVPADQSVEFPVKVSGTDEELAGHYLIVSGLKRGARMSSGVELMFDTWHIDVSQLAGLQLFVPAGFARRQHVDIELRRADGTTREKSKIVITTPGAAAIIADDADDAGDLPAEVRRMVDEGEVQIDNGSIQGARILFERAAGKGSARAALLLAGSYDARVIAAYKTATPPTPDADQARRWYQRAIELGATRATQTLESLP